MAVYSERTRRVPNVPLTYNSVCERIQEHEHESGIERRPYGVM